jgi:hypothetical protein
MTEELKPCPFCGKPAYTECVDDGCYAMCPNIECEFAGTGSQKAWNTRPIEDALRAELEAVKVELQQANSETTAAREALDKATDRMSAEFARLAEELQQAREAQRWIPVSERLPESETENRATFMIAGIIDGFQFVSSAAYDYRYGEWQSELGMNMSDLITHWRPLPEPPQAIP